LGPKKIWGQILNVSNFKENKGLFGPKKNKLGFSLRTKKGFLGKSWGKNLE